MSVQSAQNADNEQHRRDHHRGRQGNEQQIDDALLRRRRAMFTGRARREPVTGPPQRAKLGREPVGIRPVNEQH